MRSDVEVWGVLFSATGKNSVCCLLVSLQAADKKKKMLITVCFQTILLCSLTNVVHNLLKLYGNALLLGFRPFHSFLFSWPELYCTCSIGGEAS